MAARFSLLSFLLVLSFYFQSVCADGIGVIGAGKWMYKPYCAHACRTVLAKSTIPCIGDDEPAMENTPGHDHHQMVRRHMHGSAISAECYLKDTAFLRTMALCISEYCQRDDVSASVIEEYWAGHLATGSIGHWSADMKPKKTYAEALVLANADVKRVGMANIPYIKKKQALNSTSHIKESIWIENYNGHKYFEINEVGHGRNSIAISVTTVALPFVFSLLRFLPIPSQVMTRIHIALQQPFMGTRVRQPVAGNLGLMPTRGQALFIAYIIFTNIFLAVFPYYLKQPNYMAESDHSQLVMIVGDRAGVLAFANFVALFLFSARNNILLSITDWSHSTFLLLHRWVGYACIYQTVLHSILMLYWYDRWDDAATESQSPYWYWGIIATLSLCLMWPLSILPIRQRVYELFLVTHQIFAALILIGCFLHIYYLFEYNWGYEIWIYIGGGIWFTDRVWRIARVVRNGLRTATVTVVEETGEYMHIQIDDIVADGHVYLYFPTLSWRFWENHPFSVLSTFSSNTALPPVKAAAPSASSPARSATDIEKNIHETSIVQTQRAPSETDSAPSHSLSPATFRPSVSFLLRTQNDTTKRLFSRASTTGTRTCRMPVLVESSYHANPAIHSSLVHCSSLVCIAGGVGITAVMPILRSFPGPRSRLCWGVRADSIVRALDNEMAQLRTRGVAVETVIGARFNLKEIVEEELLRAGEGEGDVGIVVCGPVGMADECRRLVGDVVGRGGVRRGVVFIDEAFSW